MTKIWLICMANLLLAACGNLQMNNSGNTASVEIEKHKVGDTVAFSVSREGFGEGKVESIDGSRYNIKYGQSNVTKEASDVYALPKPGAKPTLKTGDVAVAKMEDGVYWAGVEITGVNGDVIEVKEFWRNRTASLSPDKFIMVRRAAIAEFQKLKTENEFSAKAKQAKPRPPAEYKPKVGDRVVAEWATNAWWEGEIAGISGAKAKIKWGSFPESEIVFDKIMPYPTPENSMTMPAANSYVLVKSASDPRRWEYAQVTAINGNSGDVKFANGKTQPIKADEFIALN